MGAKAVYKKYTLPRPLREVGYFQMGAFHLSYKVVKRLKITGYTWNGFLRQMLGPRAEN